MTEYKQLEPTAVIPQLSKKEKRRKEKATGKKTKISPRKYVNDKTTRSFPRPPTLNTDPYCTR